MGGNALNTTVPPRYVPIVAVGSFDANALGTIDHARHIYTTMSGDTVAGIAAKTGTDLATLMSLNTISDTALVVEPGWELALPNAVVLGRIQPGAFGKLIGGGWYQLAKGDRIDAIANRFNISIKDLQAMNPQISTPLAQIDQVFVMRVPTVIAESPPAVSIFDAQNAPPMAPTGVVLVSPTSIYNEVILPTSVPPPPVRYGEDMGAAPGAMGPFDVALGQYVVQTGDTAQMIAARFYPGLPQKIQYEMLNFGNPLLQTAIFYNQLAPGTVLTIR